MKIVNATPYSAFAFPNTGLPGRASLAVIVKGTFTVREDADTSVAVEQHPVAVADVPLGERGATRYESDLVPFKPRADVIVVGHAYAPAQRPAPQVDVSLRLGPVNKTLRVFGDRAWRDGGFFSHLTHGAPQPFTRVPLSWEHSYGGVDAEHGGVYAANPIGTGFVAERAKKKSAAGKRLPNFESPAQLISGPTDRPEPVGLGVLGKGWAHRARYLGTYDERWQLERAPAPPADFAADFYNAAPRNQQIEGYLRGGEIAELINLSANGLWRARIPADAPAIAIRRSSGAGEPVGVVLDTAYLLPDDNTLVLVWRGRCAIDDLAQPGVTEITIERGTTP
jgi:hypothetical protein